MREQWHKLLRGANTLDLGMTRLQIGAAWSWEDKIVGWHLHRLPVIHLADRMGCHSYPHAMWDQQMITNSQDCPCDCWQTHWHTDLWWDEAICAPNNCLANYVLVVIGSQSTTPFTLQSLVLVLPVPTEHSFVPRSFNLDIFWSLSSRYTWDGAKTPPLPSLHPPFSFGPWVIFSSQDHLQCGERTGKILCWSGDSANR